MSATLQKQILAKALDLCESGEIEWGKGHLAVDKNGCYTNLLSLEAFEFASEHGVMACALGLIGIATHRMGGGMSDFHACEHALERVINYPVIPSWNDGKNRKREDVIEAFRKALKDM